MPENKTEATFSLAAIRERSNAATPGPWRDHNWDQMERPHVVCIPANDDRRDSCHGQFDMPRTPADAEFIAHAREDIPALCDVVERLRGFVDWASDVAAVATVDDIREQARKTLDSL